MARHKEASMDEEQWRLNQGLPYGADDLQQRRRVEYPAEVVRTSSREELMECIKRGQRPTWVPNSAFQALRDEEDALIAQRQTNPAREESNPLSTFRSNLPYLPGLAVSTSEVSASPPNWLSDSPRPTPLDVMSHVGALGQLNTAAFARRRAPSLGSSLSSSFVMRAPTSPLVYSTSNRDQSSSDVEQETPNKDKARRRTMPPNSFHSFSLTPIDATPPNFSRPLAPALRREASLPAQTHASRNSLSSFTYHPRSNPQTPFARSRGSSMISESGSRRRKSMVGSFEESILRGRMSTPPSKPLHFLAQIGVMGKGDCPSSLKCPAHVSVPFPAVFYSYHVSAGTRSVSDDTPSPYVGTIDLNQNLKPVILAMNKSKRERSIRNERTSASNDHPHKGDPGSSGDTVKLHVGGAYRVPQQGQLQIMIKNPNKTAVKLFLIPYDLSGMDTGTKTFVRQRSFSTGPIIDSMQGDASTKAAMADPLQHKHILRYLVHLKFCCPAKNRFYLFDTIRIVFANRVPDGKEKLRNELQQPEPKYSIWKPVSPEEASKAPKSAPDTPTVKTFEFEPPQFFGDMDGFSEAQTPASPTPLPSSRPRLTAPIFEFPLVPSRAKTAVWSMRDQDAHIEKTPFRFPDIKMAQTPVDARSPERPLSPVTGFANMTPLRGSPTPWKSPPSGSVSTRSYSPIPVEARDSLLSKQFKELNSQSNSARATPSPEPATNETSDAQ
ncbi:hypothetical protein LTR70_006120 [Exophiala xenobiotica]|uniref:Atos-like conserved domain-containing protein n=1 Tax=Lithohypha guttulata TaxID=1690604 RepID=A0ABR0K8A3_9EURO|nr:hypothetical protein LTR24_005643 [Lithohypha guttulata]KAK5316873.1 hypothetical protein LTR70_006120 [Exophiala xenobiotica]